MRAILTIIRIYIWLLIIWAIMSWIPGLSESALRDVIGIPIVPVLRLFSFATANIGGVGVGFQAIILIFLLSFIERFLDKKVRESEASFTPSGYDAESGSGTFPADERAWWNSLPGNEQESASGMEAKSDRGYVSGESSEASLASGGESQQTGDDETAVIPPESESYVTEENGYITDRGGSIGTDPFVTEESKNIVDAEFEDIADADDEARN